MKQDFENLYLDFSNTGYSLYVVYDKTTGKDISGIIPAANDLVAVGSFVEFIEKQKDKIQPYSEYVLKLIGHYNVLDISISLQSLMDISSTL